MTILREMYVQQDAQMNWRGKMTYWWILVCTVLLAICPNGEGSSFNFDFRPEDFTFHDVENCPPNTIFCMERRTCVNLDGTCIEPPTCNPDEIQKTDSFGLQQCVLFENTCRPDEEEGCDVNGVLTCVPKGQCSSLRVTLRVDGDYTLVMSENYMETIRHFKTQIAGETGLQPQQLMDFSVYPGSIYILFRAPLSAYDKLTFIANNKIQFLTDRSNNRLNIDWSQSWIEETFSQEIEGYFDGLQICKQGQIYCFQTQKCVNVDGTCPAEPVCSNHQMLCNTDGKLECLDYGLCSYVGGYLYLSDANFDEIIGPDFENVNTFTDHLKTTLSNILQVPTNNFWGFSFHRGSLGIFFFATLNVYQQLVEYKNHQEQFITDMDGNLLLIDWERSYVYEDLGWRNDYYEDCRDGYCIQCLQTQTVDWSRMECVPYGSIDDNWHIDSNWQQCKQGQFFCFETMRCINADGSCPVEPICESQQMLCNTGGKLECVDHGSCSYVEGYLYLIDANFEEVIGHEFENAKQFTDHLRNTLSNSLQVPTNQFWDFKFERGSIGIFFSATVDIYNKLVEYKSQQEQFITDIDGNQLLIDWERSYIYEHSGWSDDYYEDCRDGYCIICLQTQTVDWNRKECVPYDSFDDSWNFDSNWQQCKQGQFFCFETLRCINADGSCPVEPICESHQVLCNADGKLECLDHGTCTYAEGYLYLNDANFDEVIGPEFENAKQFTDHLKNILSNSLQVPTNQFWNFKFERGSIGIFFSATVDIYNKLVEYKSQQEQFITDIDGNQLLIDWERSYIYEHSGWNDEYYEDCMDGYCIHCLPTQTVDWSRKECVPYDDFDDSWQHDSYWQQCKDGQIFCFETLRCINADGSCPVEPICESHQTLCNTDGSLECVEYGTCSYVEGFIYLENADFKGVIGHNFENLNNFANHFKKLLSSELSTPVQNIWGVRFEKGSIGIHFSTQHHLYDAFLELMTSQLQFITDLNGTSLHINWEHSFVNLYEAGDSNDDGHNEFDVGGHDFCPDCNHEWKNECSDNKLFCLETNSCVSTSGQCPLPECHSSQAACYTNSKLQCSDYCEYTTFTVVINTDFDTLIGSGYERYDSVRLAIVEQIAEALGVGPEMLSETNIYPGSVVFWARTPYQLYDSLYNLLILDKSLTLTYDGVTLDINYERVEVYKETFDSSYGWLDNRYHGDHNGPGFCPDCNHENLDVCGNTELFCFETLECVTNEGTCADAEFCPNPDEELCQDEHGNHVCQHPASCYSNEDFISVNGELTLDAEYEQFMATRGYFNIIQDIKDAISELAFIDSARIHNVTLRSGSIIAEMTFVGLPEELNAVIQALQKRAENNGAILIGGMPVQIFNFISDNILDEGGHDDFDDKGRYDLCPNCYHGWKNECADNKLFCLETMSCVSTSGQCPLPECHSSQAVCYMDSKFQCSDNCEYTSFTVVINADFYTLIGSSYKRYDSVRLAIVEQIADALGVGPEMISETYISPGSVVFWARTPYQLYDSVHNLLILEKSLTLTYEGVTLVINYERVEVYKETFDSNYGWTDSRDNGSIDGTDHTCPNCYEDENHECDHDELFCFETLQCVTNDGMCSDAGLCSNPLEEKCPDGKGGYICLTADQCGDMNNLKTTEVSIVLDGDYTAFVEGKKENVMNELQMTLPSQLYIDASLLNVRDLAMGSIVINVEIGPASVEELKAYIMIIKSLADNKETIVISGTPLTIISVDVIFFPGHLDTDHYESRGNMQTCPSDQMYCLGKSMCVATDNDFSSCHTEMSNCSESEEFCLDENGYGTCVTLDTCSIKLVTVTMLTDGDYATLKESETVVVGELKPQIAALLDIKADSIIDIRLFQGSLGIDVDIYPVVPFEMEPRLQALEQKIIQSEVIVSMLGTMYIVRPDSFSVFVEYGNPTGCKENGSCLKCLDHETQCENLGDSQSVTCVPKDICLFAPVCPVPEKDTLSTCQNECDPKTDKPKATGELCCPNACGGGVYLAVNESYLCPRDEITGACLRLEDTQCETDKEWCTVSFSCETRENCEGLAKQQTVDETKPPERFILLIPLITKWESSVVIFKTHDSEIQFFQEALIEFETSAKPLLVDELTSVEDKISVGNMFVYTENKDLHQLTIYADLISEIPGTVTVEEIREKVKGLTFTSNYFPEISHVPEDEILVVLVKDNAERQLFILPEPVVAGTDTSFTLLSVIPNDLFISSTVEATLNCSGQAVAMFIDGTDQQTADISSDKSIILKHEHQDIEMSKCRITSKHFKEYQDGRHFYIGYIAIPKPIETLGTTHIELNEDISMETEEDIDECISLPDNLFVLKSEGDALFDIFRKWPERMTGFGEIWRTANLPVVQLIQNLLQTYQLTRSSHIQSLRITASVDQPAAAVIYYKDEPLRPDVMIDLMANVQNMQDLKICVSADYSGLFNLVIMPIQSGSTGGNEVLVPIHVTDRNDPPFFLFKDFSQAVQEFAHPAFSIDNTGEMTVSVFGIGDILSVLATDVDSENLGMALLGYLPTSFTGTWQSSKNGSTWEDLNEITVENNDDINVTATLLRPEDKIRYTTSENGTWKLIEAPKLAFLAWDLSDLLNIESDFTNLIALTRCNILAKGLKQYCRQDDYDAYSTEVVVLPLARMGCDGVANSGLENLRCGCGDDTSCLDCHNVPNGGVVIDKCGMCGGNNTVIDCHVAECRQNKSLYCSSKDAFLENVDQMCDEGQELVSLEYSQYCEDRCIENGQDIREACSVPCDILECLDCANEVGKNDVNPCGQCNPIASLNEGCETIGLIQPPVSVPRERLTLTVEVVSSLVQGDTPVIECILEKKDPAVMGIQVPEVLSASFKPGNATTAPTISLDLQMSLDDSAMPVFGEFAVTCIINNRTVSTADADQYLLLYDIPALESVTPEYASVAELSQVTVTGSGIFDTGKLFCVTRCLDTEDCEFRAVKGARISETHASCPVNHLLSSRIGQEYILFVILDELSNMQSSWLTQSKSVSFSVVMPAPTVIAANLNKDECRTVTVEFDTRVSGVDESTCSFYFTSPSFSADDGAKCILPKGSKYLYIQNVNADKANQQLTFKSNVIKSAAEKNTASDRINFLSGSVTVQGEEMPLVEIDPRIPDKVGCTAVTMRPMIKNKGCWEIEMSWTVTAEGADAAHINALQSAIGNAISFQISGSQLQDELTYKFTLNWQAGDFSGTNEANLMKDSESTSAVSIHGIKEEHDVAETINVKAIIKPCDENDYNIEISWTLTPAVAKLQYTDYTFTRIPEGSLQPLSSYELSCSVKFGNGETITVSASFKTRALPIKAGIRFDDDISTNLRELGEDADVTLACINLEDPTNENENAYTCTWTCLTNLLGDTEDQLFPCLTTEDSQLVQLELVGQTITSKGADRLRPPKSHNLIEKWTVMMEFNGQTSTASKVFKYKYVPVELSAPEIEIKRKDNGPYYVSEDVTSLKIETYCRKATSYKWAPTDEDGFSVLTSDVFVGITEKNIEYSDIYKDCSIELDFSTSTGNILTPGELYAIKIVALNIKEGLFLSNNDQVFFQYVQRPLIGMVEVIPEAEVLVAWTTKLIVSLTGWWDSSDGTDLKCHLYYHSLLDTEDSVATRLTTLSMNLQESFTFTLPEGRFKIRAKCCNSFYMCSVSEADEEVQVQPAVSSDIVTTLEQDIQRMTAIESDAILGFLGAFKSMLGYILPDASEAEKAANLIIKAVKQSITIAFAKTSDRLSKLAVIEQVPKVVSPEDLDSNSKSEIQGEVTQFVKDATGKTADSSRKRKRRSTFAFSEAVGLTEEEATTVLNGFEATISQNSISKSDAVSFKDLVDDVMLGMCQAFTGSTPWVAPATFSYLRVQKTSLAGYGSTYTDVSCGDCSEVEYPAKVNYGQQLETRFNDTWDCIAYTECTDVCVATAQLNVDTFTPTVETVVAPTRMSDIIILKMINPKSYQVEDISDLNTPVEASLTLNGTIDMEKYDYKCLMWVSDDWSDVPCDTSTPTLDENTSQYKAICSCKALGIIGIFQVFKQDEETTTSAPTSTSPLPDVSSTTPAPSKSLKEGTDFTKIQFKFTNEFEGIVGSKEDELKDKIKQDIIEQTGFDSESIRNLQIAPGSIVVTFELYKADTDSTLGQMVYKLENMIDGGSITFSTTDGTPLNLKPGSFSSEEVDSDVNNDNETNSSDSNNLPLIIGGALGGVVIICVTTIIVVLIVKSKKQRTHPTHAGSSLPDATRYNTPPPTYAVAPPPPYMYVDPPNVNKWVENELKRDKKPISEKRPASNGSNGSGSSYDHKVKNKALRSEPTPVGE